MASEVVVRPATTADGDEIGPLTERVYRSGGFTDDAYSRLLLDGPARIRDAHVLVAELDGRIVGSVTVAGRATPWAELCHPDEVEVRMLAVAEDVRRRGVAHRLMDEAEAFARRRGARGVVLSTEPLMHAAHRLYERRGYERTPDRDRILGRFELLAYRLEL